MRKYAKRWLKRERSKAEDVEFGQLIISGAYTSTAFYLGVCSSRIYLVKFNHAQQYNSEGVSLS